MSINMIQSIPISFNISLLYLWVTKAIIEYWFNQGVYD